MRRSLRRALQASAVATGAALALGVAHLVPEASAAASGGATGYASQNGGTTGGAGGAVVRATSGTQIHQALCGRASSSTPIVIQVEGTIDHGNTTKVSGASCNTAADKIELKDISNVTLVGVGSGAVFDQLGIHVRNSHNIVVQNVTVRNVKKSGSPTSNGGDAIGMETDVSNVWVDHTTLEASGGEDEGYDSLFDLKDNTRYVTLSYSILRNSGRGGLVGSSDSDTSSSFVTYHHNLYQNIDSRTPLLRGGTAHVYDNYYVSLNKSGINPRAGGKVRVDDNYFQNSKDVLGTFYTDLMGSWQVSGNIYDNVTWSAPGTENHPAGPDPQSTTSVSIPYSFTPDPATCVPALVRGTAGAGTGLKVSDGSCSPQSPSATATASPSRTPTPTPTSTPTSTPTGTTTPTPTGTNLSIGAGSDGSSKASGTSYGNVRDGDLATYWSPSGSTGDISVKWDSAKTVGTVVIREASGAVGAVRSWQLVNGDTGAVLASGSGAGTIGFGTTSLKKITFRITAASGTPRIAEFETYAGGTSSSPPATSTPPATTTTPPPSGNDVTSPTAAWPTATADVKVSDTVRVSGTFDGGNKRYHGLGDGGQSESQPAIFELAAGSTLKNVIIGSPAGDGVHCLGTCTLVNVWWEDVGEDAATFMGSDASATMTIRGGGARSASDKVFQHNAPGTMYIEDFQVRDFGKLYRACGNCTNGYQRHVVVDNVYAYAPGTAVVGINTNWGDTARITRLTIVGDSSRKISVCDKYRGVPKGSEPTKVGSGPDGTNCLYSASDVTYR